MQGQPSQRHPYLVQDGRNLPKPVLPDHSFHQTSSGGGGFYGWEKFPEPVLPSGQHVQEPLFPQHQSALVQNIGAHFPGLNPFTSYASLGAGSLVSSANDSRLSNRRAVASFEHFPNLARDMRAALMEHVWLTEQAMKANFKTSQLPRVLESRNFRGSACVEGGELPPRMVTPPPPEEIYASDRKPKEGYLPKINVPNFGPFIGDPEEKNDKEVAQTASRKRKSRAKPNAEPDEEPPKKKKKKKRNIWLGATTEILDALKRSPNMTATCKTIAKICDKPYQKVRGNVRHLKSQGRVEHIGNVREREAGGRSAILFLYKFVR